MDSNCSTIISGSITDVVCARVGGANTTPYLNSAVHFAKQKTNNSFLLLQNMNSGDKNEKVQKPARIPPQTPPAGGKSAEAGPPYKLFRPAESILLVLIIWILLEIVSNFVQKTPPSFTFSKIERCCLGAKRLGMVFFRNFEGRNEIQKQSAVGNAEVRRAKLWQNEILQTNLFSFVRQRADERLSVFFLDCPKTNLKTIWTT